MTNSTIYNNSEPSHLCFVLTSGTFLPHTVIVRGFMARVIFSALTWTNCSAPQFLPGHAFYIPRSPHCNRMAPDWEQLNWRCLYATPPIPTCPNRSWGARSSAQLLYESRGSFAEQPYAGWILPSLHSICRKAWIIDMTDASNEILLPFIPEGPDGDRGTILARGSRSPCPVYRATYKQASKQVHNEQESKYKSQLSPWSFLGSGIRYPALGQAVKNPLSSTTSWSITPGNDQTSNASTSLKGQLRKG